MITVVAIPLSLINLCQLYFNQLAQSSNAILFLVVHIWRYINKRGAGRISADGSATKTNQITVGIVRKIFILFL